MDETWHLIATLFARGGWVMYPLLALSVLSLTFSFERTVFWVRTHSRRARRRCIAMGAKLREGARSAALSQAREDHAFYGEFVKALLAESDPLTESAVHAEIEEIRPAIERFSVTLSTIITAAPMLGILGTVVGIIQSFRLLGSAAEVTDPSLVADGIAQALFTTAFGLIISIVTLFPYVIFRAHSARALARLETLAAAALDGFGAHTTRSPQAPSRRASTAASP